MPLFEPEVVRDQINSKMEDKLILGRYFASDVTNSIPSIRMEGETINWPYFADIGDVQKMTKGFTLTANEMDSVNSTSVVEQFGKGVTIYDWQQLTTSGDPLAAAIEQMAPKFAKQLEVSLGAAIDTDAANEEAVAAVDAITQAELEAGFDLFLDAQDYDEFSGILIHSKLKNSFIDMEGFTDDNKTYTSDGSGRVVRSKLGDYRGIPVYMSNIATWDTTNSECKTYIVKKNALGYAMKRDYIPEWERVSLQKAWVLSADMMFGCKLMVAKDAVVLHKTAF